MSHHLRRFLFKSNIPLVHHSLSDSFFILNNTDFFPRSIVRDYSILSHSYGTDLRRVTMTVWFPFIAFRNGLLSLCSCLFRTGNFQGVLKKSVLLYEENLVHYTYDKEFHTKYLVGVGLENLLPIYRSKNLDPVDLDLSTPDPQS